MRSIVYILRKSLKKIDYVKFTSNDVINKLHEHVYKIQESINKYIFKTILK